MKLTTKVITMVLFVIIQLKAHSQSRILEAIPVDSVVSDFPVNFAFAAKKDWQFIAYYNKDRSLTVAGKKEYETNWKIKTLPTKVGWDSHNSIVLVLDRDNCLHVSGNMHNDSLIYFKTQKPFDVTTFEKIFPLVNAKDELSSTYPSFIKDAKGKLIFMYRKGGSGNGNTIIIAYDEKNKSFSRLSTDFLFDGMNQMSAYSTAPKLGKDGYFHMAWVWRDTPHSETNHDLSYAKSKDLVNWETMDGQKGKLPISPLNKQFIVDPVPAGGGIINGGFEMFFDKNHNPFFAYHKYDKNSFSQMYIAKSDKQRWQIAQVSDWNHRWDFKGPGSITGELKITSAQITEQEVIKVNYWHVKRNNGQVLIDLKTLKSISDLETKSEEENIYPTELNQALSGTAGMTPKWQMANQGKGYFYAFRWESLGKRRFYEKVETPVKPVLMYLYKVSKSYE